MGDAGFPTVSVIVPAFNEALRIERTVDALLKQDYPEELFDVLVVDDGSRDRTSDLALGAGAKVLREPRRGAYAARNRGARSTSGEYLAFVDGDCLAVTGWLVALVRTEMQHETGLVAGRIELEPAPGHGLGTLLLCTTRSAAKRREHVERHGAAPAGNLLVKRQLFESLGGFAEIVDGADTILTQESARRGRPAVYSESAVVTHPGAISDWRYLVREFRTHYGAGLRMHAQQRRPRGFPWHPPRRLPAEVETAEQSRGFSGALWSRAYLWGVDLAAWAGQWGGWLRLGGDRRPSNPGSADLG